ncbi:MAG: phosphoribosyl-ATP diphosphatase, partial [Pseudomonadota bacterium]
MSILAELYATIRARKGADAQASYTASLLGKGPAKCAEKFGEEAVETIIAAIQADRANLTYEAADTVYHLMVLLASLDVDWAAVEAELARRQGLSGHAEKAAR